MFNISRIEAKTLAKELHESSRNLNSASTLSSWHEQIARSLGYRDWNTFCAKSPDLPTAKHADPHDYAATHSHLHVAALLIQEKLHLVLVRGGACSQEYLADKLAAALSVDSQLFLGANLSYSRPNVEGHPRPLDIKSFNYMETQDRPSWKAGDQIPVVITYTQEEGETPLQLRVWWLEIFGRPSTGKYSFICSAFFSNSSYGAPGTSHLIHRLTGIPQQARECICLINNGSRMRRFGAGVCQEGYDYLLHELDYFEDFHLAESWVAEENERRSISRLDAIDITQRYLSAEDEMHNDL